MRWMEELLYSLSRDALSGRVMKTEFHIKKELVGVALYLEPTFRDHHTICFCYLYCSKSLSLSIQSANLAVSSLFFAPSELRELDAPQGT
jgi:hypothetical protein